MHQYAALGELAYHFSNKTSLGISGGAVLGGYFSVNDTTIYLKNGGVVSVKGSWHFLEQKKSVPFAVASLSISFSKVNAENTGAEMNDFLGTDVRLGLTAGYTIKDFFQFYISPKVFGGPIFREKGAERIQGRDRHFIQAGMGVSFLLPKGFAFFINGSPLGEQAIACGAAKSL